MIAPLLLYPGFRGKPLKVKADRPDRGSARGPVTRPTPRAQENVDAKRLPHPLPIFLSSMPEPRSGQAQLPAKERRRPDARAGHNLEGTESPCGPERRETQATGRCCDPAKSYALVESAPLGNWRIFETRLRGDGGGRPGSWGNRTGKPGRGQTGTVLAERLAETPGPGRRRRRGMFPRLWKGGTECLREKRSTTRGLARSWCRSSRSARRLTSRF